MPRGIPARMIVRSTLLAMMLGGCIYLLRPVLSDYRGVCPSILMYGCRGNGSFVNQVDVFSGSTGVQCGLHVGGSTFANSIDSLIPLGFDKDQGCWVFSNALPLGRNTSRDHLVLYRDTKRSTITLQGLPASADLKQSSLFDKNVFVPSVENGELVVYCYALTGRLKHRRVLRVPHASVQTVYGEYLAVAANGCIAAQLSLISAPNDLVIFVFDDKGQIVRTIRNGGYVQISHTGNKLAYWGRGMSVVVLDMDTGRRKVISLWPQPNARAWDMLINPVGFRWDSRHQWLLCAYEQRITGSCPVYAADIRSDAVRWQRLPMNVDPQRWIMLDDLPKSICKPR